MNYALPFAVSGEHERRAISGRLMASLQRVWRAVATLPPAPVPGTRVSPAGVSPDSARHAPSPRMQPSDTRRKALAGITHVARKQPAGPRPAPCRGTTPLRVVRVFEAGQAPALAGRIVMSGRMADVCAELDRMVAHEDIRRSRG